MLWFEVEVCGLDEDVLELGLICYVGVVWDFFG